MNENIYDELKWRGMIHDQIDGVEKMLKISALDKF